MAMFEKILRREDVVSGHRGGVDVIIYNETLLKPIGSGFYSDKNHELLAQRLPSGVIAIYSSQMTEKVFDTLEGENPSVDLVEVVGEILNAKTSGSETVYNAY